MKMHNPPHPGELLKEYIDGVSVTEVAQKLGVSRVTLSRILNGKAGITPEMAVRLSELLNTTTPKLWLGMQADYDLWQIEQQHAVFNIQPLFN
ncbi:plasmid maintenance system antidote protein, XRE family [Aggregatibacter actinomycetemcomitans serotype e str. SC1083]|uniref:Plasmid maintenance system antidote protein, XRE family n=2 Tax=Aggregatibacter actinomycetemcomitans TaxID=714 RepID=G4A7V0_AGGAC|nr:plasmid maintenance system antidote protein, XRE family [Aggregatibacter actinomycetemcomitans serotype e str. SC1083]KYK76719.1 XRE family transcriptional regulator [Aggregatibacter actinomycetemcomitans serotype e str. SA3096]KYK77751.1 XRE family transcriptional regulator [Aggregatibacter actinomycetemcomitans serotype e str. SC936]KYK94938.1 XRE family transcriptional regulator [Aggregatibacter actinomycetemcomitans serotype e str. ANH9776]